MRLSFYRMLLPARALKRHGHDVHVSTVMPDEWRDTADVIVGQRVCLPGPTQGWQQMAKEGRAKLVLEIDDDLFSTHPTSVIAHGFFSDPDIQANLKANIQVADLVTVTTEALADRIRPINPHIEILPNCIPAALLEHTPARGDTITVGWAGSPTHQIDWHRNADPIARVIRRHPNTVMHLMGWAPDKLWDLLPQAGRRFTKWIPSVDDLHRTIDYHIGVIPLWNNDFNACKCIDADTRVATRRGVVRAAELKTGDSVWHDDRWRPVEATEKTLPRPGVQITTADGYRIRLTPEHRMMVNGQWTRAEQIKVGDTMAAEPETVGARLLPVRVPWPADSRMSRDGHDPNAFLTAEDGPKLDITPRWGRFLGAYVGDGSVGQATRVQISCDGQDQDWIDLLMEDIRAFGMVPTTDTIKTFDGTVLRRRTVYAASAHFIRVLKSLGLARDRPNGNPIRVTRVPEVIWRSPAPVIAEFIAGYFEADGTCTANGVQAVSKDEQLLRDMQRLLLLFGIEARLSCRVHKAQNGYSGDYWSLTLRRAAANVFEKEIGFRSERKRAKLATVTARPHSNAFKPMSWAWKVAAVEPCMVQPVDIQVEGQVFAAAGFVSHNSDIKLVELSALGIPAVCSDVGPYALSGPSASARMVRNGNDWNRHLTDLIGDETARKEQGEAARTWAATRTVEGNIHLWESAYR